MSGIDENVLALLFKQGDIGKVSDLTKGRYGTELNVR